MRRTTVFADAALIDALKKLARLEGKSLSQVIREALERAVAAQRPARAPLSLMAIGRSGRSDVAERHEELLWEQRPTRRRRS